MLPRFLLVLSLARLAFSMPAEAGALFEPLGLSGAQLSVDGMSADGCVVVGHGGFQAIRWEAGVTQVLPGAFPSQAYAVSDDGAVIAGRRGDDHVLWRNGVLESLGALPNGSRGSAKDLSSDGEVVTGYSTSGPRVEAFRWQDGVMSSLTPGSQSSGTGISGDGEVIVGARPAGAFAWRSDSIVSLPAAPGPRPTQQANAISADGSRLVAARCARCLGRWPNARGYGPRPRRPSGCLAGEAAGALASDRLRDRWAARA